ncbi:24006_t:CDS:2 [Dentiscutata erythropus]|uniref:24006_t:CDS:1 n=1 Tax=Dentiscutata erythropus TaxID=1348616 RepID=A0A9N9ESD5_9GLOM|nr:24006_t:CDS:2 [Dentiscutata erythropus]
MFIKKKLNLNELDYENMEIPNNTLKEPNICDNDLGSEGEKDFVIKVLRKHEATLTLDEKKK